MDSSIRKLYCLIFVLFVAVTNIYSQNRMCIPDVYGMPGNSIVVPVNMDNTLEITAFQFTLEVPEDCAVDISSAHLTERAVDHALAVKPLGNDKYQFMGYSIGNNPFRANQGKLLTFSLEISGNCIEGEKYAMDFSDVVLCLKDGSNVSDICDPGYLNVLTTPDIVVSDVKCDYTNVNPGENLCLSWSVGNIGGQPTQAGWCEYIYMTDEDCITEKQLCKLNYDDVLPVGGTVSRMVEFTLPKVLGIDGNARLYVKIVPYSDAGERTGNDGNNVSFLDTELYMGKKLYLEPEKKSVIEGSAIPVKCKITRSGDWSSDETFIIETSNPRIATPSNVKVLKGLSAAYFDIVTFDDDVLEANDSISIKVLSDKYAAVAENILVVDNELPKLFIEIDGGEFNEGDHFTAVVRSEVIANSDVKVLLTCENASRFSMPGSVTLPAGENSVAFDVQVIDDSTPSLTVTPDFKALADNYETVPRTIVLHDNDMPEFEMTFMPEKVSEAAGDMAAVLTVRRTKNVDSKAVLQLTCASEGGIYFTKEKVTFSSGVEELQVGVGVIDNDMLDGDRAFAVEGNVYLTDCECTVGNSESGSCSTVLIVTDDDAPSLLFSYASNIISEGGDSTVLRVESNFANDKELFVELASNSQRLEFPESVVIQPGMNYATFAVSAKKNELSDDTEIVALSANSTGLVEANCWLVINDRTLPDARIRLEAEKVMYSGKQGSVRVIVYNAGVAALPEEVAFQILYDGKGSKQTFKTPLSVNPGDSLVLCIDDLQVPDRVGKVNLQAVINPNLYCQELVYANNCSNVCGVELDAPFNATLSTDAGVYSQGATIKLYGKLTGEFSEGAAVEIYLINDGLRLSIPTTVDARGEYSVDYLLPGSIIGKVYAGACFPGERSRETMATFEVYGIVADRASVDHIINVGNELCGSFVVYNPCDKEQRDLVVSMGAESANCEFSFNSPGTVQPHDSVVVQYTIKAKELTTGVNWQKMPVVVTTGNGGWAGHTIYYYVSSLHGKLYSAVSDIKTTLSIDAPRDYSMWVYNIGGGETGKITFSLPHFMETVTAREMPSIASGDSAQVVLRIKPTAEMTLNVPVKGRIGINCENGSGVPLSYVITPVSDNKGTLIVDAVDENTFYAEGAPHVKNAHVMIKDYVRREILHEGYTGEDGICSIEMNEGYYVLEVDADSHNSFTCNILVNPGVENRVEAFIPYDAVSYSWEVVETEVEDEYVVETVMEYDVRVPKAIIEIKLPDEKPDFNTVFPVRVTNKGLLAATDITLSLDIYDEMDRKYYISFLNGNKVDRLLPSRSEVFYATISASPRKTVSASNKAATSHGQSLEGRCLYAISEVVYQQLCKQYQDEKQFAAALKKYGQPHCPGFSSVYNREGGGGSGSGGSSHNYKPYTGGNNRYRSNDRTLLIDLDNPRQFCEDWMVGHLVAVNGVAKGKSVRGVAADGVSKVKIVIDDEFEELKKAYSHKELYWTLSEDLGSLDVGKNVLEDIVYTAPEDHPGDGEFKYTIKAILRNKDDDNKELMVIDIEIVRPPLVLLHGLGGGNDTWGKFKNAICEKKMYDYFAVNNNGYKSTNMSAFAKNIDNVAKRVNESLVEYARSKYVANKADIAGHSMGGILSRLYVQEYGAKNINKLITVNTPHAGSEGADILWAHRGLISPIVSCVNSIFRKNIEFSENSAVYDLSVESEAIKNLNNYGSAPDIPAHAIATYYDTKNIEQVFLGLGMLTGATQLPFFISCLFSLMGHVAGDISQYHPQSDIIVSLDSQVGNPYSGENGSGYSIIDGYMHTGSTGEVEVQNRVIWLLNESVHSDVFTRSWFKPAVRDFDESDCENFNRELLEKSIGAIIGIDANRLRVILPYMENALVLVGSANGGYVQRMVRDEENDGAQYGGSVNRDVAAHEDTVVYICELPTYLSGDLNIVIMYYDADGNLCYDKKKFNVAHSSSLLERIVVAPEYFVSVADSIDFDVECIYSDGTTSMENPDKIVFTENIAEYSNGYVHGVNGGRSRAMVYYKGLCSETEFSVSGDSISDYVKEEENVSGNICSTISLSMKQTGVMTRQAFRGTFRFMNGHDINRVEDFSLNLEITDDDGNVATEREFHTEIESMKGFKGVSRLGSSWSVDAGSDGEVVILFIPTRNAAPVEDKKYAFGGSIKYKDPLGGAMVTRELSAVELMVSPSPQLELTYFLQRDVLADDPLTEVVEPKYPAEFALLVNNIGNADAKNLQLFTGKPRIVSNEKNLLIDFEIVSSGLNGEEKSLSLDGSSVIDFGTIGKGGQSYAQWWLQSSLMGHFTKYDVEVTHVTSYGNPELSLVESAAIHELIHGFDHVADGEERLRAFLVNDIEDDSDLPDRIYFSNATDEQVTITRNFTMEKVNELEYRLIVKPEYAGWNYGCTKDPTNGAQKLVAVECNGNNFSPQQVWQTDRTIRDGDDPIYENLIHIVDRFDDRAKTYTLRFEKRPEVVLAVDTVYIVSDGDEVLGSPVADVYVRFNKPVDEMTFTIDDVTLTCQGKSVDLTDCDIFKVDDMLYRIDMSRMEQSNGFYVLTVQAGSIIDKEGFYGAAGRNFSWTMIAEGGLVLNVAITPENSGKVNGFSHVCEYGDTVYLEAEPFDGYEFLNWSVNGIAVSTDVVYGHLVVDDGVTVCANFAKKEHLVSIKCNSSYGRVTGDAAGIYPHGTVIVLTAEPNTLSVFNGWCINGVELADRSPELTLMIDGNTEVEAKFLSYFAFNIIGDVTGDGIVDEADVVKLASFVVGNEEPDAAAFVRGDVYCDNSLDVNDVVRVVRAVSGGRANVTNAYRFLDGISAASFVAEIGKEVLMPVNLDNADSRYVAFQLDVVLPVGVGIAGVNLTAVLDGCTMVYGQLDDNKWRLLCYCVNGDEMDSAGHLFDIVLLPTVALSSDDCHVGLVDTRFVDTRLNVVRMADVNTCFTLNGTGLHHVLHDVAVKGGDVLYMASATKRTVTVYSVDGRAVMRCTVSPGVTRIALQRGVYVVCGQKVLIR